MLREHGVFARSPKVRRSQSSSEFEAALVVRREELTAKITAYQSRATEQRKEEIESYRSRVSNFAAASNSAQAGTKNSKKKRRKLVESLERVCNSGGALVMHDLTPTDRWMCHEIATELGLQHESKGEGAERKLYVRLPTVSADVRSNLQELLKQSGAIVSDKPSSGTPAGQVSDSNSAKSSPVESALVDSVQSAEPTDQDSDNGDQRPAEPATLAQSTKQGYYEPLNSNQTDPPQSKPKSKIELPPPKVESKV